MDQLMLLAQLCGEGKRTEAELRSHGFGDLESIVQTDSRQLSEVLGISDKAAIRMVRQAEELLESSQEKEKMIESKRRTPVSSRTGGTKKKTRSAHQRPRVEEKGVTPAEIEGLRAEPPREKVIVLADVATPGAGTSTEKPDSKKIERAGDEPSFWYFG